MNKREKSVDVMLILVEDRDFGFRGFCNKRIRTIIRERRENIFCLDLHRFYFDY
jgi:hypothetical protein